jgi:high-affinity iron transporter
VVVVLAVLVWQGAHSAGNPNPLAPGTHRAAPILDIGVLVFREGLECILVLAAITANMRGAQRGFQLPVAAGAAVAAVLTLVTWLIATQIVDDLSTSVSALNLQAVTGLIAVIVLLVVMNWFFHRVYWTGWIAAHTQRKRKLMARDQPADRRVALFWGLALLGFTSLYREGVEVVLFLQSYRLRLGDSVVLSGALLGVFLSAIVAVLTFVANRRLPYRRMLIVTGALLGIVLLVMVGEQVQEMQLAHWLPTTEISWLRPVIPAWMGLWFSVFPTVETLLGQAAAACLVLGSYIMARPSPKMRVANVADPVA